MQNRYLSIALIGLVVLAVLFVVRASGVAPPAGPGLQAAGAPVERLEPQGDGRAPAPQSGGPVSSPSALQLDGPAVLEAHCAGCHSLSQIATLEKTLPEWKAVLAQMEALGARLDDSEKAILLDFLAAAPD